MKKVQGKVMRVEKKHVVVVTEDGQFLRVNMPQNIPIVGDTIEIIDKKPIHYKKFKPYAAVAAVLIIVLSLSLFNAPKAYASVALDMTNSSIELTLNQQGKIIKATAKSEQGEKILKDTDITGMDVYKGVNLITNRAGKLGYLNPNEKNLALAAVIPLRSENNKVNVDEERLMNTIHDEMYVSKYDGYVVVNKVTKEIMDEAYKSGLSVNRYMLWQKSMENNVGVSEQSIRDSSTTDIMRNYNFDIEKMSPDNWCEVYENNNITPPTKEQTPVNPEYPNTNHPMNRKDIPNNQQQNRMRDRQEDNNNMMPSTKEQAPTNPNYMPNNHENNWMNDGQTENYRNDQMNDNWRNP